MSVFNLNKDDQKEENHKYMDDSDLEDEEFN